MGIEELKAKITNNAETIDFRGTKFKARVIQLNLVLDLIDQWQTPIDSDEGWDIPEGKFVMGDDLPTQPELVEVPEFVGELICWVKKNNAVPSDVISDFYSLAVDEINLPNTLDLEKLSVYFTLACHRFDFEKACIIGYTVKKEQLYWIYDPVADQYLGYDRVTKKVWWLIKQNNGARAKLTDVEISKIGERYWTFAVPVEEEE